MTPAMPDPSPLATRPPFVLDSRHEFVPSAYGRAIYEAVADPRGGNIAVEAVAGSGKSTTAVEAMLYMRGRVVYCCFNKAVAEEFATRVQRKGIRASVATIHSLGFGAVRRQWPRARVESGKYRKIVKTLLDAAKWNHPDKAVQEALEECYPLKGICELVDKSRVNLLHAAVTAASEARDLEARVDAERTIWALCSQYGIDLGEGWEPAIEIAGRALRQGAATAGEAVDFTDMIWLPVVERLACTGYDWIIVDECQDLSACQRALVARCMAPGGRLLAVGDRSQAIYRFSGADCDSFDRIVADFQARVLPLSVCYRCPSTVLDAARVLVPQIEARPDAPTGLVQQIAEDRLNATLPDGAMVLCRTTAPLLARCYSLIKAGRPAYVVGREIGKGLVETAAKALKRAGHGESWADATSEADGATSGLAVFVGAVNAWADAEREAILARNDGDEDDPALEALADRAECVILIATESGALDLDALGRAADALFDPTVAGPRAVALSTIHRAKGLQAPHVFILRPDLLPFPKAVSDPEQWQQELNLTYVAITRAQETLTWVGGPSTAVGFAGMDPIESGEAVVEAAVEAEAAAEAEAVEEPAAHLPAAQVEAPVAPLAPHAPALPAPAPALDSDALWDRLLTAKVAGSVETQWRAGNDAEAARLASAALGARVTHEMLYATLGRA